MTYDFIAIEEKWQKLWDQQKTFKADFDTAKEKFYCLEMFPYPSGRLHMGHVRNYSIGDVITRFKKMKGFNVLHPFGWDALGLPAENAAIKHKTHPETWTLNNIEVMKNQIKRMGLWYDWDRELATCLPDYYHWNQLIFIKMFEKGLVYKKESESELVLLLQNGSGQRTGGKRTMLALRIGGGTKTAEPMVPKNHRLCRRTGHSPRRPEQLALQSTVDAKKLDRQKQRRQRVF